MTEASFIVIAYNERARLERALRSISAQHALSDYEIIVVDDHSSDATAEAAERHRTIDPAVRVIRHPTNLGRGAARATGVAAATGHHIAMVDADIVLPPDWYRRCAAALERVDAVSGIPIPDGDAQYVYATFGLTPRPARSTAAITGNNALFRAEVFASVSFDPALRNGEDVALHHALARAGFRAETLEDLTVGHEEDKGLWGSLSWMVQSGIGAHRQLVRYRRLRAPDVAFGLWTASLVAAGAALVRGRALPGAAAPAAVATATGVAHLRRKFTLTGEGPSRVGAAAAVNALMMSAYFLGRLAGATGTLARGRGRVGARTPELVR